MQQPLALPAFKDNYIWCLRQEQAALVVDPGDAKVVQSYLQQHQLELEVILITHHHWDHTDGIAELKALYPNAVVYGPAAEAEKIGQLDRRLTDGDGISWYGQQFDIIAVPGHTLGHIAYYCAPWLFCGDTVFNAGCGRLFEGSPEQMWQSLNRLMSLPPETEFYPTHEYTMSNLSFARWADPNNAALPLYIQQCQQLRANGLPTLPTTLAQQHQVNPYFRAVDPQLQRHWQQPNSLELFRFLRSKKDDW